MNSKLKCNRVVCKIFELTNQNTQTTKRGIASDSKSQSSVFHRSTASLSLHGMYRIDHCIWLDSLFICQQNKIYLNKIE